MLTTYYAITSFLIGEYRFCAYGEYTWSLNIVKKALNDEESLNILNNAW